MYTKSKIEIKNIFKLNRTITNTHTQQHNMKTEIMKIKATSKY